MKLNGIYNSLPRHLHLEPTSDCNARCPQCPRTFSTTLKTNPILSIEEWSPDEIKTILENKFFKNLKKILINGNFGDVVKHTCPKEFLQEIVKKKDIAVEIRTNGGAQPASFWTWLGQQLNVTVEFGIDGLSDTHHLYRRNTRFDVIMKNAKAFIAAGGNASWAMTVFKHNEHQVKKCKKLALKTGFSSFKARPSTRWNNSKDLIVVDSQYHESYRLEPASEIEDRYSSLPSDTYDISKYHDKPLVSSIDTSPDKSTLPIKKCAIKCHVQSTKSVYLSSDKKIWPCCWMELDAKQSYYNTAFKNKFYKEYNYSLDFNNVLKYSIEDILESNLFLEIEKSWKNSPFDACASTCSQSSNRNIQNSKTKVSKGKI